MPSRMASDPLDMLMPDYDGAWFVEHSTYHCPVIVLAASNTGLSKALALGIPLEQVVPKPFDLNMLLALIGRTLSVLR